METPLSFRSISQRRRGKVEWPQKAAHVGLGTASEPGPQTEKRMLGPKDFKPKRQEQTPPGAPPKFTLRGNQGQALTGCEGANTGAVRVPEQLPHTMCSSTCSDRAVQAA